MSLTGTLGIDVTFAPDAAASVRFAPPKAVPLSALLNGCAPNEAVKRVGALFALCGTAHAVAAVSAIESELETMPSAEVRQARLFVVAAEALREHVFRIAVDWAGQLGHSPQAAMLKPAAELHSGLKAMAGQDVFLASSKAATNIPALQELAARLSEPVSRAVFGSAGSPLASLPEISAWAACGQTIAAEMLAWTGGEDAQCADLPQEPTVFGRWRGDARLTGAEASRRVLARLLEIDALCRALSGKAEIENCCRLTVQRGEDHSARAAIDVARGRLQHDVRIEGGRIAFYAISAPTGRNFEAGGAAELAIGRIRTGDRSDFERLARLAVLEIDPCVAYELRVS